MKSTTLFILTSIPAIAVAGGFELAHVERSPSRIALHYRRGLLDGLFGDDHTTTVTAPSTPEPSSTSRDVFGGEGGGLSVPPLFGGEQGSTSSASSVDPAGVVTTGVVLPSGVSVSVPPPVPTPTDNSTLPSALPTGNLTLPSALPSPLNGTAPLNGTLPSSTSNSTSLLPSKTKKPKDAVETKVVVVGADDEGAQRVPQQGNNAELVGGDATRSKVRMGMVAAVVGGTIVVAGLV